MIIANYLLSVIGILGAIDILLYHSISHGIRSHHDSRWELLTHSLRGPTYAALFLILPNFQTFGAWGMLICTLLILDVCISIADFALERKSRSHLGGLPSGEYVLHMLLAMLFGAFVTTLTPILIWSIAKPTALVLTAEYAAPWLRITLAIFAVGVLQSGFADLRAMFRHLKTQRSSPIVTA